MSEKVPIDNIQCPEDLYPRESFDNETVNNYRLNLDNLPPIVITKDFILVDGLHRLMAHRIEQSQFIEVETPMLDISGDEIYREAIRRNSYHGKQLTRTEKRIAARRLHINGNDKELSELLGVHDRTIDDWTKDLKASEREQRNNEIIELYLKCWTNNEIRQKVGLSEEAVRKIIEKTKERINAESCIPDSLQLYNVWTFPKPATEYGLNYPGRIPGQIIENLLYYYTEPFDKVIDPMAGGGTTLDVCKAMYRRCLAYDIKPVREDITKHNIKDGFPDKAKQADMIFLDPPYWRLKREQYAEQSISSDSLESWLKFMKLLIGNSKVSIRPKKYIALIIEAFQDEKETGEFLDLPFICTQMFLEQGFRQIQRIMTPMPTQTKNHHDVKYGKEKRILLDLNRDLIIFQK